jgi:hypothetical protein
MRTLRLSLAGTVILTLLASMSMAVAAQEEEPAPFAYVTGTVVEQFGYTEGARKGEEEIGPGKHEQREEDGVLYEQGVIFEQQVEWSDPRLPPEHWIRLDAAIFGMDDPDSGVMTVQTSHLLEGAEGDWRGTGRAVETADDRSSYYELTGEGAYEGLHALLRGTPGMDAHGPWDESYEGYIFEGELPPFPEPAAPATWEGFQMVPFPTEPPAE